MADVWTEEVLEIHPRGVRMTCSGLSRVGKTKNFRDCANPISKSDRALAQQLLQTLSMVDVAAVGIGNDLVVHVINSLATCTLCPGVHRKKTEQIDTVKDKFRQRVQDYITMRQYPEESPHVVPLQEVPAAQMNRQPAPRARQTAPAQAAAPLRPATIINRPPPPAQSQAPAAPQPPPIQNPLQLPPLNLEHLRRFERIFPNLRYQDDPQLAEELLNGYDEERIAQQEARDYELARSIDREQREAVDRARAEAEARQRREAELAREEAEDVIQLEIARAAAREQQREARATRDQAELAEARRQREVEVARTQAEEARAAEARQREGEEAARNMAEAIEAEARRLREAYTARNQANALRVEQARAEILRQQLHDVAVARNQNQNPPPAPEERQDMAHPAPPARLFAPRPAPVPGARRFVPRSGRIVRRQPLNDDCYICYEAINRQEDAVWCKGECGKNVHRECFEQWKVIREFRGVAVCCAHCRASWVGN